MTNPLAYPLVRVLLALAAALALAWLSTSCASPTAPSPAARLVHLGTLPALSFAPAPGCPLAPALRPLPLASASALRKAGR